ncbi:MAG: branched-chain amino acid ABC transporter permease [Candidatus Rokubacteria bacterium]|nr:branched-chain amino acid ABC transporter permease [Candidatus Rokubacteria bacterium]
MKRRPRHAALALHLALGVLLLAGQFVIPPFHQTMLARIMVLAVYAMGYNVLLGYTGLMSLGHAMFFATGMYGAGLTVYYWGFGAVPAFLVGVLASALASAAIGLLALRTSGVSFLIVTMMFSQAFYLATLYFNQITMGDQGFILSGRLPAVHLGGLRLALSDPIVKYNAALVVFVLCLMLSVWLTASPIGRVLVAVRENEERTRLLGYNTFNYKLLSLVISGGMSGASGATYALIFSYVGSTFASIIYSIYPLLWTLLGGTGTTIGPFVGTSLMTYIVDIASGLTSSYLIVVGATLVILTLWFPAGVMGGIRARWLGWLP